MTWPGSAAPGMVRAQRTGTTYRLEANQMYIGGGIIGLILLILIILLLTGNL
jgi:hypothetical protein